MLWPLSTAISPSTSIVNEKASFWVPRGITTTVPSVRVKVTSVSVLSTLTPSLKLMTIGSPWLRVKDIPVTFPFSSLISDTEVI